MGREPSKNCPEKEISLIMHLCNSRKKDRKRAHRTKPHPIGMLYHEERSPADGFSG